jgi:hypothetical protein
VEPIDEPYWEPDPLIDGLDDIDWVAWYDYIESMN